MSDSWNLIAAGPSRVHLRKHHLIPDSPTCTVNRAIDVVEQGITVNYAAFADGPSAIWEPLNLERYVIENPYIQLWVTLRPTQKKMKMKDIPGMAKHGLKPEEADQDLILPGPSLMQLWDPVLPACVGVRPLPWGEVEDVNNKACRRQAFTTLCCLERIFMFRPKRIRILSADMTGPWIDGKTEDECRQHEIKKVANDGGTVLDRWKHERNALNQIISKAQKTFGLSVDWVIPEPELVEQS